jgi:hypothetical protein
MIKICERCYAPIDDNEPVIRMAHVHEAYPDGSVTWHYAYTHAVASPSCTDGLADTGRRPDTGDWDPARGIGPSRP